MSTKKPKKAAVVAKPSLNQLAVLSEKSKKFDPAATKDDCVEDLRRVQKANPYRYICRNFYRAHGRYSDATWNQYFGTFHEFRRQAALELSRAQHQLERQVAKHASLDTYRDYYKEQVLPWHLKYEQRGKSGRFKTIMVITDLHDIELDPFVWACFVDTCQRVQPDIIVLGGDIFDLYEFSKYFIDPRKFKILERFNFVKTHIFGALRRACPNAQIDFIIGNHEARLLKHMADRTPAMKVILSDVMGIELADVFGLPEFEINMVAKLDLSAFNPGDINEEIRQNFKVYYDCFAVTHFKDLGMGISGTSGHTHRPDLYTTANVPMKKISWTNLGCGCRTQAEYVEGRDEWTNSFAMFFIDTLKKTVTSNHILIPGDFAVIEGKRYERQK